MFEATGLSYGSLAPAANEHIKVKRLKLKDILTMIKRNQIKDAKTICGILALVRSGRWG